MKLLLEVIFLLGTILFALIAIGLGLSEGFFFFVGGLVPTLICYTIFKYIKNRDV
jgi:hypothetical protein